MIPILIISIIIVFVVLILSVVTTSKAYKFEHKVDPLPEKENETLRKEE